MQTTINLAVFSKKKNLDLITDSGVWLLFYGAPSLPPIPKYSYSN